MHFKILTNLASINGLHGPQIQYGNLYGEFKTIGFCQFKKKIHTQDFLHDYYLWTTLSLQRLSQLKKLQFLDLSGNRTLREVPEAVYSLSQLTELRLVLCELGNISDRYVCII